jgi:hypothetical protein
LELASRSQAHIVALQETRHPPDGFKWAEHHAAEFGYRVQWSDDAGFDKAGNRHPGYHAEEQENCGQELGRLHGLVHLRAAGESEPAVAGRRPKPGQQPGMQAVHRHW